MVIFGPSVWPSGEQYSVAWFLFIRLSGFGHMDSALLHYTKHESHIFAEQAFFVAIFFKNPVLDTTGIFFHKRT